MGILTKYGTLFGHTLETVGNIFFVAPGTIGTVAGIAYTASDGNDGLSPDRPLSTIAQAVANATANVGDVIALLPGAHAQVGATAFSKAGLTVIGLPYLPTLIQGTVGRASHRPQAIITESTAATVAIACTAADLTFVNICFRPITQAAALTYTTACDRLTIRNCLVDMKTPAGHANTKGIISTGNTQAPDGLNVSHNMFLEGNGGTSCGIALEVAAAINFMVAYNLFRHDSTVASSATWTTASQAQDNCQGDYVGNIVDGGGGTITNGFRGVTHTGAGIVQFIDNKFTVAVTNPITAWAASDVGLLNNYVATVAGGTGGTLVTSST